jgi:type I restriction enzyme M protein
MAKKKAAAKSNKNDKGFEESLWDSANRLRGSVESSEYKHVVLSLIFLKFVSDKFEERRAALIAEGKEKYTDMVEFYTMQNVFYLPETSRWSFIQQHAKQGDIAIKIDSALTAVEKSNASLKGALPDNYFSRLGLDGIRKHDYVLTPGRYVGAATLEDDGIPFETKMTEISQTLYSQMDESKKLDAVIKANLAQLGFDEV